MIPTHALYRCRGAAGYRLVMSSTTAGGGDDLRYKYLMLERFGLHVRRVSSMDSSATAAELKAWGEVVRDAQHKAEIVACVTCKTETCTRITTRQSGTCTPCYAESMPDKKRFRHQSKKSRGRK